MGAAPIIAMNLRNVYRSFRFDTMATATVCRKLPSHACGVHALCSGNFGRVWKTAPSELVATDHAYLSRSLGLGMGSRGSTKLKWVEHANDAGGDL